MQWETNSLSNMRFGRLNLVDLAGSERYDKILLDAVIVSRNFFRNVLNVIV
jgi:hypothetical protein